MAIASILPVLLALFIMLLRWNKWPEMVEKFMTVQSRVNSAMFLLFLLVGPTFGGLFTKLHPFMRYWMEETECVNRVNTLRNVPLIHEGSDAIVMSPHCYDVTFDDASFTYEPSGEQVLKRVSMNIPQSAICALVGSSGSGKTIIARLISRFWDVQKGDVLIVGRNVKFLSDEDLFSCVSLVFQHASSVKSRIASPLPKL